MLLSVSERFALGSILPKEGDFSTLKVLRGLRESLSFSEDEFKRWQIRREGEHMLWNGSIEQESDIQIGEKATDIIRDALRRLNDQKKLTEAHFSLYEKFME